MNDGPHVLVTGATGFVGRATCDVLLTRGLRIRAAVRAMDYTLPVALEQIFISEIGRDTDWRPALEGIDIVIHLAARVHVMNDKAKDPLAAFCEVNEYGTRKLADQAAECGVERFIYVSSVKVNGERTLSGDAFNELDDPAPEDAYGISKWRGEQALHSIERQTGMPVTIIRPPLVYGPGVKANFAHLLSAVVKNIPLPLSGIGNKRSLIYVGNLADAIVACALDSRAAGKAYLVSDKEHVSTPELIRRMALALGIKARLFPFPLCLLKTLARLLGRRAMIDRLSESLLVDNSRIKTEIGWKPPFSLDQGMKMTADWYLAQIKDRK